MLLTAVTFLPALGAVLIGLIPRDRSTPIKGAAFAVTVAVSRLPVPVRALSPST